MIQVLILGISILLQFTAAILALRLIRVTGKQRAWGLIALAVFFMGVRRSITFFRLISGDLTLPPDLLAETVALVISILMVLGIAWIAPIFYAIKNSTEALFESKTRYQKLFNDSPVPLWEEDFSELYAYIVELKKKGIRDFRAYFDKNPVELSSCARKVCIMDVNQATLELHQAKNKEQLLGNLDKIFTEKSLDVFKEELIAIAAGELEFEAEAEVKTITGEPRHISLRLRIEKDQQGSFRALLATNDITKSKQAEEALQENVTNLARAEEIAEIGNWNWDIPLNKITWSDQYYRMLGVDRKKFTANYDAYLNCIHPDDLEFFKNTTARVLKEKKPYRIEYRIVRPNNDVRVIHERGEVGVDTNGTVVNLFGTAQDITERKHIEDELKKSRQQLRDLSAHIQSSIEEERTKIAREIHDELGQSLTALKIDLFWLTKRLSKNQKTALEKIHSMSALIDVTIESVQKISTALRPSILDDLGLVAAMQWQAEEFQKRTGIHCDLNIKPEDFFLDTDRTTTIFRIFQETLTNIIRHARATRVEVNLERKNGTVSLRVKDNGIGISDKEITGSKSFGLIGIRERVNAWVGDVNVSGSPKKGTTVTICIPVENPS